MMTLLPHSAVSKQDETAPRTGLFHFFKKQEVMVHILLSGVGHCTSLTLLCKCHYICVSMYYVSIHTGVSVEVGS